MNLDDFAFEDGSWFERPGLRIVTTGSRKTLIIPPGPDQLERLSNAVRAALNPGELAIGAIDFNRNSQIVFEIPQQHRVWIDPDSLIAPASRSPRELRLEAFPSPARYAENVRDAVARIRTGELKKIVLARMLIAHASTPYDRHRLLSILAARETQAYKFAVAGFIGATPELIVSRTADSFRSEPMAGTRPSGPAAAEELLNSEKDLLEHKLVVDAVSQGLSQFAKHLQVPDSPSVVETASLVHLASEIRGTLRDDSISVLDLLAELHPTPAIAGTPRDLACELIASTEGFDRTRYGGAVGWIDADGNGEFALTLRCAEVRGRLAMLFAGAGIVADSDPEKELMETEQKFQPMLKALSLS